MMPVIRKPEMTKNTSTPMNAARHGDRGNA